MYCYCRGCSAMLPPLNNKIDREVTQGYPKMNYALSVVVQSIVHTTLLHGGEANADSSADWSWGDKLCSQAIDRTTPLKKGPHLRYPKMNYALNVVVRSIVCTTLFHGGEANADSSADWSWDKLCSQVIDHTTPSRRGCTATAGDVLLCYLPRTIRSIVRLPRVKWWSTYFCPPLVRLWGLKMNDRNVQDVRTGFPVSLQLRPSNSRSLLTCAIW